MNGSKYQHKKEKPAHISPLSNINVLLTLTETFYECTEKQQ